MSRTYIKICGMTNIDDARAAIQMGADALGFIFAESPRKVSPEMVRDIIDELPKHHLYIGVFVNHPFQKVRWTMEFCNLDAVQLHGDEQLVANHILENDSLSYHFPQSFTPHVIKGLRVGPDHPPPESYPSKVMLLLDTYCKSSHGGTGKTFNWQQAIPLARQRSIMLAGGLTPDNVGEAIETVQPFAVDVSSGVERKEGIKDHKKMKAFIENVRTADRKIYG
jgi:phosphoribosylanthranilate isomerase